ncbi:MAG: M24 family metallopeptidase [Candidatus Kapabacteria bacterium]|nr:M24 family metallopeptidase [Candidatus Kapabacteria bacterium]
MKVQFAPFQEALRAAHIDAWVMYDFRGTNDLAWTMLDVPSDAHCTRRFVVVIPAHGNPVKIVHSMERGPLSHLDIKELSYDTRQSWTDVITSALSGLGTVAMEYSPMNAIPVASKVDAGTIEFIRSLGVEVVSSADIAQQFTSVLSEQQLAGAAITAGHLRNIMMDAFRFIRTSILDSKTVTEYDVQQRILEKFHEQGLVTDSAPIVAIGPNAASPHYAPSYTVNSVIERDMVVLIDAWCKNESPESVFADLTYVGYTGVDVPTDVARTFNIIVEGRNAALTCVQERFVDNEPVFGYEVDNACRKVVNDAGMGSAFIHRTGHSITTEIHGPGVNMDDYETHDTRKLLPGTSFSIEPGIYIPDVLGLRTEIDVVITREGTVTVPSLPLQTAVLPLLADEWEQ